MLFIFICFLFLLIFGLIYWGYRKVNAYGKHFLLGKTVADYRQQYPDSFSGDAFVACHNCRANSIYLKQVGRTRYGAHHQHLCRQCGCELWRSTVAS